jgi:two-component system response regulator RegX3
MRAVLRRLPLVEEVSGSPVDIIMVGDLVVDTGSHEVKLRDELVSLPLKEFELLTLLMENAGRVLPRSTLIDRVWGDDYVGDTKTLDVHVKRLRAKIEADPSSPRRIVTIRGLGYKYVAAPARV